MIEIISNALIDPVFWVFVAGGAAVSFIYRWIWNYAAHKTENWKKTDNLALRWITMCAVILSPIVVGLLVFTIIAIGNLLLAGHLFSDDADALRWYVLGFVGLLTAAGGLIAAPLAIVRLWFTNRQTTAQEQGLITDRINKAVEALGAEKEVNRLGRTVTYTTGSETQRFFEWQDDRLQPPEHASFVAKQTSDWQPFGLTQPNLEVRIGGLLALERLMNDSPRDHFQIMEILTSYVRGNAPLDTAKKPDFSDEAMANYESSIKNWSMTLPSLRSDIQLALTIVGRRTPNAIENEKLNKIWFDLSAINLQAASLGGGDFRNISFYRSNLCGAYCADANFDSALFTECALEACNFDRAILSKAKFRGSAMTATTFREAEADTANFTGCQFDGGAFERLSAPDAIFVDAEMRDMTIVGSNFSGCDFSGADFSDTRWWRCDLRQTVYEKYIERTVYVGWVKPGFMRKLHSAIAGKCSFQECNFDGAAMPSDWLRNSFGDASNRLPSSHEAPPHWELAKLEPRDLATRWENWKNS